MLTRDGDHKAVEKTWGCEVWIHNSPLYCGKVLYIEAGKSTSQHFHIEKTETMMVIQGKLKVITWIDAVEHTEILDRGDSFHIKPGVVHVLAAEGGNVVFVEFSTEHKDSDSYRIAR